MGQAQGFEVVHDATWTSLCLRGAQGVVILADVLLHPLVFGVLHRCLRVCHASRYIIPFCLQHLSLNHNLVLCLRACGSLSTSPLPPAPCIKRSFDARYGVRVMPQLPIHSTEDDDFSSNSSNVDLGRRSKNICFNPTSNDNGKVKGMIAFLKQSSSSEEGDDDDRGRRSNSLNKNQQCSTAYSLTTDERHSASCLHSPNKTQHTLLLQGTIHDLFLLSAPITGAGRGPSANTREKSDTWTEGEENNQIAPPSLSPALPTMLVHTISGLCSPFLFTGSPVTPASIDTAGLYEFGYCHAPLPLSSLPMGSSGSVPPFCVILTLLGVGGPGQPSSPFT